jgi:hypothetical protein
MKWILGLLKSASNSLGNIDLVGDIIPPGIHLAPLLGLSPSFKICFLIYHSLLHKACSLGIFFALCLFAGWAE